MSANGMMALLDSDYELHVIDSQRKVNKVLLEGKKKVIGLKWVGEDRLLLIGSTGKCLFYTDKLEPFKNVRVARGEIDCIDITVYPNNEGTIIRMCLGLRSGRVGVYDVNLTDTTASVGFSYFYRTVYALQKVTWLHHQIPPPEPSDRPPTAIHLYSLTDCHTSIVKYDSLVGLEGIFWDACRRHTIESFRPSADRQALLLILRRL